MRGYYDEAKASAPHRGVTLNSLKDELHSLNMRMLLAMQNHDEIAQGEIEGQTAEIQREIDHMSLGRGIGDNRC